MPQFALSSAFYSEVAENKTRLTGKIKYTLEIKLEIPLQPELNMVVIKTLPVLNR